MTTINPSGLQMDRSGDVLWQQLELSPGAPPDALEELRKAAGADLPSDYLAFLSRTNGALGTGPDLFVILWPAEEIMEATEGYKTAEFAPGLLTIGSDGCGNLLGIDLRSEVQEEGRYLWFDSMSMDWEVIDSDSPLAMHSDSLLGLFAEIDAYYRRISDEGPEPVNNSAHNP
jgi:hypothetical protein